MNRRIGILGGTFDPPHVGHLLAASDAFEALKLDLLAFVPNAAQPLKAGRSAAPAESRLEMVRLLCQGDARFAVDSIEVDRGGLSFTIDTVRAYRARYPGAALFLLVGEDVVETLPSWRETAELLSLVELVVMTRNGGAAGGPGRRIQTRRVDVSATEVRERIREGKSLHGFVPDSVASYIVGRGLYRRDAR